MLDFPNSPTLNQVFTDAPSALTWRWDATKWQAASAGAGAFVLKTGDTMTGALSVRTTTSPGLTVSANAAALLAPSAGTMLQVAAADGTPTRIAIDNFASFPQLQLRTANGTPGAPVALASSGTVSSIATFGWDTAAYGAGTNIVTYATQTWNTTSHGAALAFSTVLNGSTTLAEAMRIDHNGFVGIGDTASISRLSVMAADDNALSISCSTLSGTQAAALYFAQYRTKVAAIKADTYGNGRIRFFTNLDLTTPKVIISAAGDLGIGGDPDVNGQLDIQKTTRIMMNVSSTNCVTQWWKDMSATSAASIGLCMPGGGLTNDLVFSTYATGWVERMRIQQTTGNVGINTGSPNYKMHVKGQSAAGLASIFGLHSGPNGADATTVLALFGSFAQDVTIGQIARTGTNSVVYQTTSDARLKDNITESERGLDALMAIKVSDYRRGETEEQGLLAQDVHQVYPEAVREGGEDPSLDPWMIDYGRLTPLLIRTIQQLVGRIEALEGRHA